MSFDILCLNGSFSSLIHVYNFLNSFFFYCLNNPDRNKNARFLLLFLKFTFFLIRNLKETAQRNCMEDGYPRRERARNIQHTSPSILDESVT